MGYSNIKEQINLEYKLGEDAQVLQIQAIDQIHMDGDTKIIFIFDLSKVDLDYPVVRFNKRFKVLDGDAIILNNTLYYPGLTDQRSYMYLNNNIAKPTIIVELM